MEATSKPGFSATCFYSRNAKTISKEAEVLFSKIRDGVISDNEEQTDEEEVDNVVNTINSVIADHNIGAVDDVQNMEENQDEEFSDSDTENGGSAMPMQRSIWTKRNCFRPLCDTAWISSSNEKDIPKVLEPIEYFSNYITEELYIKMTENTNIYGSLQGNFTQTTVEEMKTFIGLHIYMGTLSFPRIALYWNRMLGIELLINSMRLKRFYKLRSNFHLVNNLTDLDEKDRLWKVRPIYDCLQKRCSELTIEQRVSIDEQMVPFKGTLAIKQYIPSKPNPWGIKIFVLCGESGIVYDFIIYQGATTELDPLLMKEFGLGGAVVLHLCKTIQGKSHQLFVDNFFNSYKLLCKLYDKQVLTAGTARINRFVKAKMTPDKEIMREKRGFSEELFSKDGKVVVVKWADNKAVVLASNFVGIGIEDCARRWDKKQKDYLEINRPEIIKRYNSSMGGVDKMDMLIALYRIFIRSRKWTLRMIFHAVDLAINNSWLEYVKAAKLNKCKHILDLMHFRIRVAEALVIVNKPEFRKRGRPTSFSPEYKKKCSKKQPIPEIRFDGYNHWPVHMENPNTQRCKYPECKLKSNIMCEKCQTYLCLRKISIVSKSITPSEILMSYERSMGS